MSSNVVHTDHHVLRTCEVTFVSVEFFSFR